MMKNTYQLAAFDVDGTLLDSNKCIRKDSKEALLRASALGKLLCLSTGRDPAELAELQKQIPMFDYIMCISGALILNNKTGEKVYERSLSADEVLSIFERSRGYDAMIHLHGMDSHVQRSQLNMMERCGMGVYRSMFEKICIFHDDIREEYRRDPFPVYKFNLYCADTKVRAKLEEALSDLPITMCHAETKSLECSPLGISKASGLKFLCEKLGIPVSSSIAVGDADNDIEIMKAAGLAIAMGNANERVKAIAHACVADCDSCGIRQVIDQYLDS